MRLETGVVQEGDDWPGIFIRGDNALYNAMMIDLVLKHWKPNPESLQELLAHGLLGGLSDLFKSCDARNKPLPQMVKLIEKDKE